MPDTTEKSIVAAYVLWLALGAFGAHRFYLGERGTATALLLVTLMSVVLTTVAIGFFTIWITVVWLLADAFLIPGMVQRRDRAFAPGSASS